MSIEQQSPDPTQGGQQGSESGEASHEGGVSKDEVRTIVSGIVASALKKELPKIVDSQIKGALGEALGPALAAAIEPLKASFAAAKPADESASGVDKSKPSPELVAMQKQLADMQAALRAKDEEAAAERKRAREDKAFADLTAELTGKVRPGTEKMVATLLKANGQLVVGDDGNATVKVKTALFKGQAEEEHEFPIADGVGHYLKSKDAALFLPAPSGGAGGGRPPPNTTTGAKQAPRYDAPAVSDEEKNRRVAERLAALGVGFD
jgi:hypothetical protein